jgi:putative DNA primase/helicase
MNAEQPGTTTPPQHETACDFALRYLAQGVHSIPLYAKSKRPIGDGWEKQRLDADELRTVFSNGQNLGILNGEPSGGWADVDLDCDEALNLCAAYLPPTATSFGRGGYTTHHIYRATPADFGTKRLKDPTVEGNDEKGTLVELRGTGSQTMAPPSIHPDTGQIIEWYGKGDPHLVSHAELLKCVEWLGAACLLARNWPKRGGRHDAALALAGALAHAQWKVDDAVKFINPIAKFKGEGKEDEIRDTFKRRAAGKHVTGQPTCSSTFGDRVWDSVVQWLHLQSAAVSADDWPDPEPLPGGLPAVPALDPLLLPKALRPWINDIAQRAQAPLDYPAATIIVTLASALGRRVGIYPKQHDSWLVIPNLWGVIIGPPGYLKSPMMHEPLKPLQRLERKARERYEKEFKEWQIKRQAFEGAGKKGLSEDELRDRLREIEDQKPIPERYIANDATIEKLGELLKANPNGLLLTRDELGGFLGTFERQGHEADRAFYCQAWNGYGSYTYDRIGRGSVTVENLCLSVLGCITPGPLSAYLRETFSGARDDGLIQRFQLAVYPDTLPQWKNIDRQPNTEAEEQAKKVFEFFLAFGAKAEGGSHTPEGVADKTDSVSFDSDTPRTILRFSPEAQEFFNQWRTELETRLKPPTDEHPIMLAHLGKYRSLMPSLALISHLCDSISANPVNFKTPVTLEAAKGAAAWCEYFEAHARRLYYIITSRVESAARFLGEKIQRDKLPDPFTARDVYRPQWTGLSDPEDVTKALELLEDINWVRAETKPPTDSGGRPRVLYHVNPKVSTTL